MDISKAFAEASPQIEKALMAGGLHGERLITAMKEIIEEGHRANHQQIHMLITCMNALNEALEIRHVDISGAEHESDVERNS